MASIINERDLLLQNSTQRAVDVTLPSNVVPPALKAVTLSAPSTTFRVATDNSSSPSAITLNANLRAISGTPTMTWSVTPTGAATLTGTDYGVRTLTYANMAQDYCTVRVEVNDGGMIYFDETSFAKVRDGSKGVDGRRGSISAVKAVTGSTWSDAQALQALVDLGISTPLATDTVTLYNASTSYAEMRRYSGTAWVAVEASLPGSLLMDGSLGLTKFASGIEPVKVVSTLPTTKASSTVFLTSDSKLYRWGGTQYTKAVDGADIAANSITAGQIAAGAIKTDELDALAVTAAKIATGAVTADKVTAGAITTEKLLVTGLGIALNPDPNTQDISAWTGTGLSSVTDTTSPSGSTALECIGLAAAVLSKKFPIDPTKNYKARFWTKQQSGTSTTYGTVAFYDASGNVITGSSNGAGWPGRGSFHYFGLVNGALPAAWTEYSISFGPDETAVLPSNARFMAIGVLSNYTGTGVQRVAAPLVHLKTTGDMVVDGTITAGKIDARGLSIKDSAGNVILAAGTALSSEFVNPDAGWLNSNLVPSINTAATTATWSGVTGADKPLDNAGRVLDTRSVNNGPSTYGVGNTREFKTCSVIGLTTSATYCVVETIKGWSDSSGGEATQWAYVTSGEVWKRSAGNGAPSWGSWVRDVDRSVFTGDLAATKNSVGQGLLSARPTGADGDFYYATDNGTLYQKMSGAWSTSSTNTYVDSSGKIQGVSSGAGLSVSNNEDSVIRAPGGGVFVTNTATMTGRMKVTLPQSWTNTMMRFTVEVYEYSSGYMCTLELGGYNYLPSTSWHNVSARVIGGSNVEYPVYFGHDGTKCCIWVGAATNETWSYPQVRVRDFFAGYSNYSRAQWESGWAISFDQTAITSGTGANQYSASVLDTLPGADWAKISGTNKPADGANRTYLDASGQLQGVSGGAGTTVSNSYIGINASGELYGAGAGNGIKVSNNQIYIDGSGAVQGIGSGSGTQVANSTLVPTINAAATTATWSNVSGAGKPADGATSGSNLVKKPTFADGSKGSWGAAGISYDDYNNYTSGNFLIFNTRDTLEVGNDFAVIPGETIYVSAAVTSWQSQYTAGLGLAFFNSSGSIFDWRIGAVNPAMTGWNRRKGAVVVPAGAVKAVPWFQIDGPGGQTFPVVWGTEFYIGRAQEGATVGMSEIESSTGLTSVNGWSLNKNGSFKAVGSGNSIQVSPNAASISFTKPDGNAAFFVNESGSALFGGSLTAATGTFAGTLAAGVLDSASFDSIKYVYPNSGNYGVTVPAKKAGWASLSLKVTMVGAGGGGGGGAASGAPNRDPTSSGGGGGAGQKSVYTFNNLSSGAVIPITVGAGGAGGGANTTWNGSSVSGGSGGSGGSSGITVGSNSYYASGGTGGGAGTSALADDFGYYGNGTGGGAGGSLGGSPGSGGFRISAAGGAGGSSEFGNGGGGGSASYRSASAGGAGSIGAGGGGGGADASDAGTGYAGNGGAGGSGYILFEFYDPNTVVLNGRYSALISWLDSIGHGAVPSNAR